MESRGPAAERAKEADVRVKGLGSAVRGTAGCKRAFCGRMTVESIICLENSLVNLREKQRIMNQIMSF